MLGYSRTSIDVASLL